MSRNEPVMSQRERFEAWVKGECNYSLTKNKQGDYLTLGARLAWKTWQAACPEGWQALPVDPTAGMLTGLWTNDPFERYSAILAAAPKPEDV